MALQVKVPLGYSIVSELADGHTIYTFRRADHRHKEWFTWIMDAVDAAWCDVRARATLAALDNPVNKRQAESTLAYALGYSEGKAFVDVGIRKIMAQHGYEFSPHKTPAETVRALLDMLTPKS